MFKFFKRSKKKDFNFESRLVSNLPMIFYEIDLNGIFTVSEGKGLQQIGLKPGEAVGRDVYEMYKDYPDILEAVRRSLQGESVYKIHKLGDLYLENYLAPLRNQNGKLIGMVGTTIDVTEKFKAEQELGKVQNLQNAIINSIPGLLYMYNENGELVFWNSAHESLTGYTEDELRNFQLMDWYKDDPESQQAVVAGLSQVAEKGYGEAEANLQTKDGRKIPFFFTACPIEIDGESNFVGIGIDISSRKKAEEELRELNKTLEKKVEDRTQELRFSYQEISDANEELVKQYNQITKMKDYLVESEKMNALASLVAGVAHEVNTPVGIGITASSHLNDLTASLDHLVKTESYTKEQLNEYLEDVKEAAAIIEKNLTRAGKLIQAFKKLSIDQSSEPERSFNVLEYLNEILLSMSPSLKHRNIKVHIHCPDDVKFNSYPGAFAQIITNLIMNSIIHAYDEHEKGDIHIKVEKQPEGISVQFSDNGKGMDEEMISRIYEPFFTTKRSLGGSGLGLSVVYSLVTQKFNGSIECISKLGEGVKFMIELNEGER